MKKIIPPKDKVGFKYRDIRNYNFKLLEQTLHSKNWDEFFRSEDPNLAWKFLYLNYYDVLNEIAPVVKMNGVKEADPWVTTPMIK